MFVWYYSFILLSYNRSTASSKTSPPQCDLVFPLSISSTFPFTYGDTVASYVFFLVFPSPLSFPLFTITRRDKYECNHVGEHFGIRLNIAPLILGRANVLKPWKQQSSMMLLKWTKSKILTQEPELPSFLKGCRIPYWTHVKRQRQRVSSV